MYTTIRIAFNGYYDVVDDIKFAAFVVYTHVW